jgi:hypothetical protein
MRPVTRWSCATSHQSFGAFFEVAATLDPDGDAWIFEDQLS